MKYASVYERKTSPYWWVYYWHALKLKRVWEITPFRKDDPQGRRKALDLANEKSKQARAAKDSKEEERWENWVDRFLEQRYSGPSRSKSLTRMKGAWAQWRLYLNERRLVVPRALDYRAVIGFIEWRMAQVKLASKKQVSKNTALIDVKCMSVIVREAMHRGYCEGNHCERLGILKDAPRQKPEIRDDELKKIRAALKKRPEWMRVCFEIAIHQGCRLSETSLPLERINVESEEIQFWAKGRDGKPHVFTTRLHPGLKPLIGDLKRRGKTVTCELPRMAAKEWHFFFKELGLSHLCFHCTRVTVITRLARAGVPMAQAMAYVGHASALIHHVYQRLTARDVGASVAALQSLST